MKRRTAWLLAGLAIVAMVTAACSGADAGDDGDDAGTATPTGTATEEPTGRPGDTSMPAGPDVEEDRPPHLVIWDGTTPGSLELGTYCWTGMCADAIGIITTNEVYTAQQGAELQVDGLEPPAPEPELPVTGVSVLAYALPDAPVESGEDWQAWHPADDPVVLQEGENGPFAVDLEPGRYLLNVFVSFDGGDASYGLVLEVQ